MLLASTMLFTVTPPPLPSYAVPEPLTVEDLNTNLCRATQARYPFTERGYTFVIPRVVYRSTYILADIQPAKHSRTGGATVALKQRPHQRCRYLLLGPLHSLNTNDLQRRGVPPPIANALLARYRTPHPFRRR
jgi:hypothetical protein